MTNWTILGIEPTDDREAIRRAYMTMLPNHNPEDDPEGFLRLRTAYDDILRELDKDTQEEETPHTLFMKDVAAVYNDFKRRKDENQWKSLLENPVCQRLDMVDEAEFMLLSFILDNYNLPMVAWATMSAHFDWPAREKILLQMFPSNFVDYALKKAKETEHPRFDLFIETGDVEAHYYDQWITLFMQVDGMISAGMLDAPELTEKLAELETLPLTHPYKDVMHARIAMSKEDFAGALTISESLYQSFPEDIHIWFSYASVLAFMDRAQDSIAEYEKMLQANPSFTDAKRGILHAHLKLKDYEAANKIATEILDEIPYDSMSISSMQAINEGLIENMLALETLDKEAKLKLAECYMKLQKTDECLEIIESEEFIDEPKCKRLRAACAVLINDLDRAVSILEDIIATDPTIQAYDNMASVLIRQGRNEEALVCIEKAEELPPDKDKLGQVIMFVYKCQALAALNRHEEAMAAADAGLVIDPQNAHLCAQKANLCAQAGRYNDAMEYSDRAISIYPFMTDPHVLQMEIYSREGMYEQALDVANRAQAIGYDSPKVLCHKAMTLRELGQYQEAESIFEALLDAEHHEGYKDTILAEYAVLMEEMTSYDKALIYISDAIAIMNTPQRQIILAGIYRKQGEFVKAMEIYNNLLAEKPDFVPALVGKGSTYARMGVIHTAMEHLTAAIKAAEYHEPTYNLIVDILSDANQLDDALDWSKRRLERFENLPNRILLAIAHSRLSQYHEAEDTYKKAIELYPDVYTGYRYYGLFLQSRKRFKEAIELFEKSLELDKTQLDLFESTAYCLQEEKAFDQALQVLDMAEIADEDPYNLGALAMRRATIYEDMLRYGDALEEMRRAASIPDKLDGEWELAWIYTRIGLIYAKNFNNADMAMEYFKKAVSDNESYLDAVDYMGDVYQYAYKDYAKAVECYNRKIESEPGEPHSYVTRARAYMKMGRFIKARRDYKKALELYTQKSIEEPSPCWAVYIANCKLGLKQIAEAKQTYESGLNTPELEGAWCSKPKCDVCLYSLGLIAEQEKRYDDALSYYQQAIEISNSIKHNAARDALLNR